MFLTIIKLSLVGLLCSSSLLREPVNFGNSGRIMRFNINLYINIYVNINISLNININYFIIYININFNINLTIYIIPNINITPNLSRFRFFPMSPSVRLPHHARHPSLFLSLFRFIQY